MISQEDQRLLDLRTIKNYKEMMAKNIHSSFPYLSDEELDEAITWAIINNYDNPSATLNNNYTKQVVSGTVVDILGYIDRMQPIITSSGVLYKRHKEIENPLSSVIQNFLAKRKVYKDKMKEFPRGSQMFEKYNLLQQLEKLNANSTYGLLGNVTSALYNIYVAESITRNGRSYITNSIMFFEAFLSNNVKFNSLDEIITYIHNICEEKPNRKYDDTIVINKNISRAECFNAIMSNVDPIVWIPTEKQMTLVWERLLFLPQEDLNRIYYKNNLYSFCGLEYVKNLIIKILASLEAPFMNPNKPPEKIVDDLNYLTSLLEEYVYYPHIYIDKLDRAEYMQRDSVIIVDTDSCIVSFDAWYRFVLGFVYNIDLPIKHEKFRMFDLIKEDAFGERPKRILVEKVKPQYDYNFYTDEVVELERKKELFKVIPQDSLRYSIINIIAYVCYKLIVDYMNIYCKYAGSYDSKGKGIMIMKNEYLFDVILLTANRRNYGALIRLQEGNIVPRNKKAALNIAGLPINKTTLSDGIKAKFQDILYEDIMTSTKIDQIDIMKKLVIVEKEIIKSIMNKETTYYKPDNVAPVRSYAKDPLSVNGVRACLIYNELRTEGMEYINLEERNKIFKIKINVTRNGLENIKDKYPEIYDKLTKLLENPVLGKKVDVIGFPIDAKVPDWVLEFVDVATIVNDNIKNFPLESIGLRRLNNDTVNYSNIISL